MTSESCRKESTVRRSCAIFLQINGSTMGTASMRGQCWLPNSCEAGSTGSEASVEACEPFSEGGTAEDAELRPLRVVLQERKKGVHVGNGAYLSAAVLCRFPKLSTRRWRKRFGLAGLVSFSVGSREMAGSL